MGLFGWKRIERTQIHHTSVTGERSRNSWVKARYDNHFTITEEVFFIIESGHTKNSLLCKTKENC